MPRTYATLGGRSSRDYANAPSAQIPDSYIDGDSHLEGVSLARDNGSYRANPAQHLVREIPQGLPPTNLARVAAAPPLIIVRIVRPSKSLARKASEVGPERQAQQSLRCESEGFSESLSRPSQSRAPSPRGGAEAESETRRWIPESAGVPEPRSVYPWLSRGPFNQAEIARIRAEEAARRRSGLSIYAYMMERARSFYTFSSAPGPTTAGLDQATAQASATGTDDDVTKLSPMLYTRESPDSDSEDGVDAAVEPVDGRNIRPVSPFWRDGPTGSEMDSLGSTPSSPIVAGDQTFASIYEALQRVPAPLRPTPATPPTPTPAGSRRTSANISHRRRVSRLCWLSQHRPPPVDLARRPTDAVSSLGPCSDLVRLTAPLPNHVAKALRYWKASPSTPGLRMQGKWHKPWPTRPRRLSAPLRTMPHRSISRLRP